MTVNVDTVNYLVPLVTPLVIAGVKAVAPRVPKMALPVAAPVLGALLDVLAYYAGVADAADPVRGAVLGALGVWLRELVDQVKKAAA